VILPATAWPEKDGTVTNTDRMVQLGAKALEAPGEAKPDLWIIQEIARVWDATGTTSGPADVFNEMRKGMNSIAGITWDRLERESSVTYPCEKEGDPGQPIVFIDKFQRQRDVRNLCPADIIPCQRTPR
jgi:formate dehydrogenase major subunit